MTDDSDSDHLDRLEARLAMIPPRPLPGGLERRIERSFQAAHRQAASDRFLLSAMAAGALAACTIITMLLWQPGTAPAGNASASAVGEPASMQGLPPRLGDYPAALARADQGWPDSLR